MTYELATLAELAGREMDALISERVFGLVRCRGKKHDASYPNTYCYAEPDSADQGADARCYSTEINDAWQVVEKLAPRFEATIASSPIGWSCEFKEPHPRRKKQYQHHYAAAHSAPLAICRAALKAVGGLLS